MKSLRLISCTLFFAYTFTNAGCQPRRSSQGPAPENEDGPIGNAACTRYAPVKIDIAPLTEFIPADNTQRQRINLYISLLDQFGSQVKSPGRFRFELYEHVQRSAEPKGKRLAMWPELDLTDPLANNAYWRDFLRAYEFTLPLDQAAGENRILEVTFFCPSGKRISSEFTMR
ncbi:MAG: hypothetical protein JSW47_00910 [Phycisphaerales bacterium]|nr:MAG: hypothetical protein JSW47_00910 [Phycisphaerales bacterium]